MKVIRKKADPGGGTAAAPAAAGTAKAPMILNRSKAPPKLSREEEEAGKVASLLEKLALAPGADESSKALLDGKTSVEAVIKANGFAAAQASGFLELLVAQASTGSSTPEQREAALLALAQLPAAAGRACEPYMVPLLPTLLDACADKSSAAVRSAALAAGRALMGELCPHAVGLVLPVLFESMADAKKWQTKEAALKLLSALAAAAPGPLSALLPDIVPVISELMVDPREQVKAAAAEAGAATFALMGNRDIAALVPDLLGCVARPGEVADVVTKLSATTFVQAVEAPALAVMVPLLLRGVKDEQPTPIKRKACVIITNMSKLVSSPVDASKFLPRLQPGVERIERTAADPELRDVAAAALAVLNRVGAEAVQQEEEAERVTQEETLRLLRDAIAVAQGSTPPLPEAPLAYIASLAIQLIATGHLPSQSSSADAKALDFDVWRDCTVPFLAAWIEEGTAEAVGRAFMAKCGEKMGGAEDVDSGWADEDAVGADRQLCDCRFSLAYGGKILLNNAQLRLMRGRRYGLCGGNGVGKSTLMKAIAKGQLDGFPPASELRTVYVEHDIQASLADHTVLDYVAQDPIIKDMGRSAQEVAEALTSVGFAEDMLQKPVTSCSGGWKMKLALARAMLLRADILLLDEPTNHLDTTNVAWLINYLVNQPDVTSMIVSHDSGFLDAVCTDIIHYHNRQLRRYKGNLSHFVEAVPAAKSYYELEAATLRFRFPTPGLLDGITTKEKPIVKLSGVSFTYPGATKPQLTDVNIMCRLSSRVAVLGVNGAGKSTLIKMVTGETKADKGTVWRHPNLRMAYVAQHAFHHLEEHLDTTPLKYMFKRYGTGEDKEESSKVTRAVEEEDKAKMAAAVWVFDGHPRRFNKIISRRKKKKDFEYEVEWQGLPSIKFNRWIARAELIEKGFTKFVNEFDGKKAAAAIGSDARPLTKANVEKFLQDFGLEPEFGTHSNIRGLSGGQKVKLVLAAAMWLAPHLLIMDEPTNYLDREALGALAAAIRDFDGGVVLISHNSEFTSAITNEVWQVADGKVVCHAKEAAEKEQ